MELAVKEQKKEIKTAAKTDSVEKGNTETNGNKLHLRIALSLLVTRYTYLKARSQRVSKIRLLTQ